MKVGSSLKAKATLVALKKFVLSTSVKCKDYVVLKTLCEKHTSVEGQASSEDLGVEFSGCLFDNVVIDLIAVGFVVDGLFFASLLQVVVNKIPVQLLL